jgi:hypothetical protein
MDGGLENTWLMDSGCSHLMIGVAIWFSNLTHLLLCVWFLWDLACGYSVCLTCIGGHSFSYSINTHESNMRFHLFDGFIDSFSCGLDFTFLMDSLTPFHVGWDEFVDIFLELLCWFTILFLWCFFGSSYVGPLRSSRRFVRIITLAPFFELISHGMLLIGTQWLLLWTKFCILLTLIINWVLCVVSRSWVLKYLPTNPLGSKTWISLSCHI